MPRKPTPLPRRIALKRDLVIPAGTVFECCDGMIRNYAHGNYEAVLGLSKDTSGSIVYGFDVGDIELDAWFEVRP